MLQGGRRPHSVGHHDHFINAAIGIGFLLGAVIITLSLRQFVALPSAPILVAIALTAQRGSLGVNLLYAVVGALALDCYLLRIGSSADPAHDLVNALTILAVAVVVMRVVDDMSAAQRSAAQLDGVKLAGSAVADRLANSLAVAAGTLELLRDEPGLPPELAPLVMSACDRLFDAGEDLKKLQQVSHVETCASSMGRVLDLDRSAT
jgi:hypothetical protein